MKKKFFFSLVVVLIVFRLSLPTLIKNYINKELNQDPIYRGQIEDVGVHLWRGAYSIDKLKIEEVEGQKIYPFLSADSIDIGLSWRELFHFAIVAKIRIINFEMNIVEEPKPQGKKVILGEETRAGKKVEAQGWQVVVNNLVPLRINTLHIEGSSIHFRDLTSHPQLNIYLDQLQVEAENLTNTIKSSERLPATVDLEARALKSGVLNVHILLNPLVTPPEFKANLALKNLNLTQLNDMFTVYADFDVKAGRFDLFSEVATAENNIKGYLKPLIVDLDVANFKKDTRKGLGHAMWEETTGFLAWILKNFPKDRQAAIIPFEGKLDQPKTSGWAIAKSILHNMFIKAIPPQIDHTIKLKDVKK